MPPIEWIIVVVAILAVGVYIVRTKMRVRAGTRKDEE